MLSKKLMGAQSNRIEGNLVFRVEVRIFGYWEHSDKVAIISTGSKAKNLSIVQNKLECNEVLYDIYNIYLQRILL